MTIKEQKTNLRHKIKNRLAKLPNGYLQNSGRAIAANITAMQEYQQAETVFAFVSTSTEPDTYLLLKKILADGKRLAVPLCVDSGHMEARVIAALSDLHPGSYGIMEPSERCLKADPSEIQLAVIPCVTCDHTGRRLGHGGGYYDRFLAVYSNAAAMVCPEMLLCSDIPQEPFDHIVSIIVTENNIYRSSAS